MRLKHRFKHNLILTKLGENVCKLLWFIFWVWVAVFSIKNIPWSDGARGVIDIFFAYLLSFAVVVLISSIDILRGDIK